MCIQHNVILTSLCKWKRPKWLFFVVKRYAVRQAKKWRYAVRNAKIERYAVRNGGGACHPLIIRARIKTALDETGGALIHRSTATQFLI